MLLSAELTDLEVLSYRVAAREVGWKAMWSQVFDVACRFKPTAIYWQHMVSGEIDEEILLSLKKLPSRPVIVLKPAMLLEHIG